MALFAETYSDFLLKQNCLYDKSSVSLDIFE
jgi:hypothetical protein